MLSTHRVRWAMSALVMVLTAVTAAHAKSITVLNHSFEAPFVPMDGNSLTTGFGDDFLGGAPPDWSVFNSIPNSYGVLTRVLDSFFHDKVTATPDPSDNEQLHWANRPDSFIYQILPATLLENTTYTLTVDLGQRTDSGFENGTQIRLGYGAAPGVSILTPQLAMAFIPPDGGWVTWESVFQTGPTPSGLGEPLRIELISGGQEALFDNVRLEAIAIGEPSTFALSALGLFGICLLCRSRCFGARGELRPRN